MSNQEMQFADPDWEPTGSSQQQSSTSQSTAYTPQPVNDDRRERFQQPIIETPSRQEGGYAGYPPYSGAVPEQTRQAPYQYQQMPYRQPRRRRRAWFWIIVAILIISLMSGGASALGSIGQKSVTESIPTPSLVSGTPTIIIDEADGNIQVHQGGSLSIQEVKKSGLFDDPNNIQVNVDQSGNTITISVNQGSGFLSERSVDFNITVPTQANLQLTTSSGDISVSGTSGNMSLSTVSGDITTINDTFSGNAALSATSGTINSSGDTFNGFATLATGSGDVKMNHDVLNGPATAKTASGDIDFNGGTIASSATYQFSTDSGDVHVGLPADVNFAVQADTSSGSIHAGDFPTISVQETDGGSGNHASGTVGTSPGSSINISTGSGDITIHKN